MKIYQIRIDTMLITLLAESESEAFEIFKNEEGECVYIENGQYEYKFDEDYTETFIIQELPMKSGIIQYESH